MDSPFFQRPRPLKNCGLFLAFEGLDGSGKSTQAKLLLAHISKSRSVFCFKEPTNGPWGKRIKELSARHSGGVRDVGSELDLFLQDRSWDLRENILPAMQSASVIMDRYILSTAAYQGALGQISPQEILEANRNFPWPDLTFLLELPVSLALKRIIARGKIDPLFEQENYLKKVKQIYDDLSCPGLIRLDGTLSQDEIFRQIAEALDNFTADNQELKFYGNNRQP
jgi:dTMP kinase